ncbi:hypothetical protein RPD_0027 [Rhodopseudomonas palustris BisB5]|uniref:TniQ domain-containing protein n=1 Tax=Rhodopseudomonas palustris (strain BisB5) TaxID=316057 RepID=Q13F72_RHOPS|nr:hypothetical protein RPD_0027 [Rhodopseudomonas palustris BisB5]
MLPTSPHRNVGEGAIGFLMRLGETHGVRKFCDMLRDLGIRRFDLSQGIGVDRVARAAMVARAALQFDSGTRTRQGVMLRGELLRPRQWSVHAGRRGCPACFAGDRDGTVLPRQWHRAWWDIRAVTVCPLHGLLLIDACPRCGVPLDFKVNAIGQCRNGHPLWDSSPERVTGFAGDEYIVGRLVGSDRIPNSLLDAGRLGEAIDALDLVGRCVLAGHHTGGSGGLRRHVVLAAGFECFIDWPAAFDPLLDGLLRSSKQGVGKWGAAAAYGPLHYGLQELGCGRIAMEMKAHLRRHAAANGVSISKPVFGTVPNVTGIYSVRHAARRFGMGFEGTRTLLAREGVVPEETRRGTPIRISTAVVDRLATERSLTVGLGRLADHLALGRGQTRRLVGAGFLGDRRPRPSLADADAMLAKLCIGAPANWDRSETASLPDACRSARCSIEVAVRSILAGAPDVKGYRPGAGLRGIFVRVSDLRAVGKLSRGRLTLADAAAALRVKWETARALAADGLLVTADDGVHPSALDNFQRDFIAAADLAKVARVRSQSLIKQLSGMGVSPAAGPPNCRQVFYRRSSLRAVRALRRKLPGVYARALGQSR